MTFQCKNNIILQRQENLPTTCCFYLLSSRPTLAQQQPYLRMKARSEPKLRREKKIDLVTIKRGFSLNRLHHSPATLGKNKPAENQKSDIKLLQNSRKSTNAQSKSATQKSSIKTLKTGFSYNLKIERGPTENRLISIKTTPIPQKIVVPEVMIPHSHEDLASIPYMSDISIVSQDFISRQSVDANIFTLISATGQKRSLQTSTMQHQSVGSLASSKIQERNPLQRILDRNRVQKGVQGRKRLVL